MRNNQDVSHPLTAQTPIHYPQDFLRSECKVPKLDRRGQLKSRKASH